MDQRSLGLQHYRSLGLIQGFSYLNQDFSLFENMNSEDFLSEPSECKHLVWKTGVLPENAFMNHTLTYSYDSKQSALDNLGESASFSALICGKQLEPFKKSYL